MDLLKSYFQKIINLMETDKHMLYAVLVLISILIFLFIKSLLKDTNKSKRQIDYTEEEVSEVPIPVMESAKKTGKKKSKKTTLIKHQPKLILKENITNNKKHILIVDDSKLILKKLGEILSEKYIISLANSGFEALEKIEKEKPDLILSDIEMPQNDEGKSCSGFDLLTSLQSSVKY